MKKLLSLLLVMIMLLTLVSCGSEKRPADAPVSPTDDPSPAGSDTEADPIEPVMNWFHIKTNTGINTLLMELENPNPFAVDIVLNVEYIKDGQSIGTSQDLYALCFAPGEKTIIWDTWEVPGAADSVRITYTMVMKSVYTHVESTLFRASEREGYLDLDVKPAESVFTEADVIAVFFSDGVPVAFGQYSFYDSGSSANTIEVLEEYDDFAVYANVYK